MNWWVLAASSCHPRILFLSQTHTCKIGGRQILVLHRRCNRHPERDTYYYNMFTCIFSVFFCPTISKRSKAKMIHTQREKKTGKNKEIQLSVPCCDPPQMERKTDTWYKNITIFIYQTACGGFVQKSEEGFYLLPFFFDYFLQFQLSDAHQCALHQLLLFYFLFHITKLHFYSHIFKFKFLFWYALQKATTLSHLLNSSYSSIKASK